MDAMHVLRAKKKIGPRDRSLDVICIRRRGCVITSRFLPFIIFSGLALQVVIFSQLANLPTCGLQLITIFHCGSQVFKPLVSNGRVSQPKSEIII